MLSTMPRAQVSPTDDKSMVPRLNGALSPLHTRRGACGGDMAISVRPDFATYDLYPFKTWLDEVTQGEGLRRLCDNTMQLQEELDKMLVHNIDHQRKLAGELQFQTTGEYPADDISNRLMPKVQLLDHKVASASQRRERTDKSVFDEEFEQESVNSGDDFGWPPLDLPRKLWVWLRQYIDPIDEDFIVSWKHEIMDRFMPENMAKLHEMGSGKKVKSVHLIGSRVRKTSLNAKYSQEMQYEMRYPNIIKSQTMPTSQTSVSLKRLSSIDHNRNLVSPNKRSRLSSVTSPKVLPLMDDLVKAYFDEQAIDHHSFQNGVLDVGEKRKMMTRKDSVLNGNSKIVMESLKRVKKEAEDDYGTEEMLVNGTSETSTNGVGIAECAHTLAKLGYALKKHLGKSEFSRKQGSSESSDSEEEISINNAVEEYDQDEVSLALKKCQKELCEHEQEYRNLIGKVWNRLLAKFIRDKREAALNKASRELYDVYDKYYCDYQSDEPKNERQRSECRAAMQKYITACNRFYNLRKMKTSEE
ncbi:unnamed protein product [Anisakis simplex]|uniref:SAM domain-containing protein n=1 Tax=Anisakis simplex TaxID=6269 RepID=A0A0M3JWM3_ANISI|nr:unnamed protein product [Anisakis simplex]